MERTNYKKKVEKEGTKYEYEGEFERVKQTTEAKCVRFNPKFPKMVSILNSNDLFPSVIFEDVFTDSLGLPPFNLSRNDVPFTIEFEPNEGNLLSVGNLF